MLANASNRKRKISHLESTQQNKSQSDGEIKKTKLLQPYEIIQTINGQFLKILTEINYDNFLNTQNTNLVSDVLSDLGEMYITYYKSLSHYNKTPGMYLRYLYQIEIWHANLAGIFRQGIFFNTKFQSQLAVFYKLQHQLSIGLSNIIIALCQINISPALPNLFRIIHSCNITTLVLNDLVNKLINDDDVDSLII